MAENQAEECQYKNKKMKIWMVGKQSEEANSSDIGICKNID